MWVQYELEDDPVFLDNQINFFKKEEEHLPSSPKLTHNCLASFIGFLRHFIGCYIRLGCIKLWQAQ